MRVPLWLLFIGSISSAVVADEPEDFFESNIRPVLVEHCYACHSLSGDQIEGGLRLDSRESIRRGGDSGPAVEPHRVDGSLLISALKYESLEMPPDRKLPQEVIADFEKWIGQGAVDPRDEPARPQAEVESEIDFTAAGRFWSFRPPVEVEPPVVQDSHFANTRIDQFIRSRLAALSLEPAPAADTTTLLRRLTYDLTGLPPNADQLTRRPQLADEVRLRDMVDELLSSPAFGEHWVRMWLDLMRYAEDQAHIVGNNTELCFPNSYRYRDWVIEALNRDMPYDQFIRLQLAADQLTPDDPADDVALGFIGLGPKYYRRNAPEVMADEWEDRVDVVSRGLLGLTVACARCHDHKYDPISTADYYALAGVFASTEMYNRPLNPDAEQEKNGQAKKPEDALHIVRDAQAKNLEIMIRGDVHRLGPTVPRGFLTILSPAPNATHRTAERDSQSSEGIRTSFERTSFTQGSGRAELAEHIASNENPLTARVFVNRVWNRLIGKPLVGTPSNFGSLGERPTHPDLLDDLAIRFMQEGWSLKWLCREIVCSATYRQSSCQATAERLDPENRWLARMNRKRLHVEQWRDALLLASGRLDGSLGGGSIDPSDPTATRRTIYSEASRLKLNPMLALFDYPDPNTHSARRAQTTTASQKLFLMNSPLLVSSAQHLAQRLRSQHSTIKQAIDEVYRLLFSREPTSIEFAMAVDYLSVDGENFDELIHALMITNEMFFID